MKTGNNRNPKGKLYTKYFNSVRNLKTNGLIESPSTISKSKRNVVGYKKTLVRRIKFELLIHLN